jgi:hypothetical protein
VDELEAREQADEDRLRRTTQDDLAELAHQAYSDIAWKSGRRVALTPAPPAASQIASPPASIGSAGKEQTDGPLP